MIQLNLGILVIASGSCESEEFNDSAESDDFGFVESGNPVEYRESGDPGEYMVILASLVNLVNQVIMMNILILVIQSGDSVELK